ncbi:uncharacterized protein B0I36DRAFT_331181 [Microdochium trichocladiopsis]|uniref:DUF7708 domain-containing protein n=1 Tax=Microdochium trichocladiopsis TaxID=1682393 RepID=A0A9P9BRB3_9PEZI|nr:uncharacterized protein B0I36DRAFT_331181 [Microdochium trichocladiopsis]KAH7026712.1 hypothetical protein B0I36DRAFT_331181 [Microdochium trichocladiopsis]
MESATQWYLDKDGDPHAFLARDAFQAALAIFTQEMTNDTLKRDFINNSAGLEDVQRLVRQAQSDYENKPKNRKVQKWLHKIGLRIQFYGNVLDIFIQHNPEYVALAWGAFRLLFTVVLNNAKLLATLSKALCQIADSLPRVELATILYPTPRMKEAVVQLYAHIINFLIRSKSWYDESKLQRMVNAITRPAELRYDDIIQDIERCKAVIDCLSTAGARAEQRDMHLKIQELGASQAKVEGVVNEIRRMCIETQTLNTNAFLDTNQRLTDLQLNSIMTSLSRGSPQYDPLKTLSLCQDYQTKIQARTRARITPISIVARHPKFRAWQSGQDSALLMIKGDSRSQDFVLTATTQAVRALREHQIPVVWVLKPPPRTAGKGGGRGSRDDSGMSTVELLRNLVYQILRINLALHTEKSLSLACSRFDAAETPAQWFDLLASITTALPALYIVINIEAINTRYIHSNNGFSWLASFLGLLGCLEERQNAPALPPTRPGPQVATNLKVLLVSHGSATVQEQGNLAAFNQFVLGTRQLGSGRL